MSKHGSRKGEGKAPPTGAEESRNLLRGAGVFAFLTGVCRATGVVRTLVVSSLLSAGVRDAFMLAFTVPNLFRNLFGEGALTSGFVPVYVERIEKGDREGADRLAGAITGVLSFGLGGLAALGIAVSAVWRALALEEGQGLTLRLLEIMLPFLPLVCLYAFFMAVLTSHRRFAASAAAPTLLNIAMIAGAGIAWWLGRGPEDTAVILAVSVVVGGVLQLGLQLPGLRACGATVRPRLEFSDPGIREIGGRMLPVLVGASAYEACVLINRLLAARFCGEGAVSYLFNANILVAAPMGIVAVAAGTAALPVLSSLHARKDRDGFRTALTDAARLGAFLLAPCAVVLMFNGGPIVRLLFERGHWLPEETAPMGRVLFWYSAGLIPTMLVMLGARAFYAMKKPWIPATIAVGTVAFSLTVGCLLVWDWDDNPVFGWIGSAGARWGGETWAHSWFGDSAGLAFATCLAAWLQAGLVFHMLGRAQPGMQLGRLGGSLGAVLGVAAASALVVDWVRRSLPPEGEGSIIPLQQGIAPVVLGLLAYWLAASLVDLPEYRDLWAVLRRDKGDEKDEDDDADEDDDEDRPGLLSRLWSRLTGKAHGRRGDGDAG